MQQWIHTQTHTHIAEAVLWLWAVHIISGQHRQAQAGHCIVTTAAMQCGCSTCKGDQLQVLEALCELTRPSMRLHVLNAATHKGGM